MWSLKSCNICLHLFILFQTGSLQVYTVGHMSFQGLVIEQKLRGKSPCLLQITSKFLLTSMSTDFLNKIQTDALSLKQLFAYTHFFPVWEIKRNPTLLVAFLPLPTRWHSKHLFPSNWQEKKQDQNSNSSQCKETKSPLCSLYILFICYSGKRCTDVFHYYLALTVNFKNSLSSPLEFCKGLSFTISHFYAFILYNSSYLSCPSLILIQILFCFSRNT